MDTNGYHATAIGVPKLDLKWTSHEGQCQLNRLYVFEEYGGLEKTRTSDLFRVKEAL